jgi:flavin-dependent dehydrogenase
VQEQIIIGAGLAGLVAGINLAREGFDVLIRERRKAVGGETDIAGLEGKVINIGDGTPMRLDRLRDYTGIDFSPAAVPLKSARTHIYGKTLDFDFYEGVPTFLFERGPRQSSLDVYLYELARSEGVEFKFDDTVTDLEELPAGTIIATGLFDELWEDLQVPHLAGYGYLAMSETDDRTPRVIIYFDDYSRDYAFYSQINGACGACLFSRSIPLAASAGERFKKQLLEYDGITFDEWKAISLGTIPVEKALNPRLFAREFILAGTLSGSIDPFLCFGVHGALVTGKIAAIAVTDRQRALEEFSRANRAFKRGFYLTEIYRHIPLWMLKHLIRAGVKSYPAVARILGDRLWTQVPGFRSIQRT